MQDGLSSRDATPGLIVTSEGRAANENEVEAAPDIEPITARRIRDTSELLARERDARRKLETEKVVRERLLALMTREVMTHANVAKGWVGLVRREHLHASAREAAFAKMDAALTAQLSLLDELVGMSPAAVGHLNLDCRRIDIAAIARAVAADVGDDRVHVIAETDAMVIADMEHLVRALRALIEAATRATHPVRIHLSVSGDYVRMAFSNAIGDDDAALGVARRVAQLYGGEIAVAGEETVFRLPSESPSTPTRE